MGRFVQWLAVAALCILPRVAAADLFDQHPDGAITMRESSDGSRSILLKVSENGRPTYYSEVNGERTVIRPSGALPDWSSVPLAIGNSGDIFVFRSKWEVNSYKFELFKANGEKRIIGQHPFENFWTTQGIGAEVGDDGSLMIHIWEIFDSGRTIETNYAYDGVKLTQVGSDSGLSSGASVGSTLSAPRKKGVKGKKPRRPARRM